MRAFSTISVYFNSQPHKEADTSRRQEVIDYVIISTHSLTRRLTQVGGRKLLIMLLFQLTASQGG